MICRSARRIGVTALAYLLMASSGECQVPPPHDPGPSPYISDDLSVVYVPSGHVDLGTADAQIDRLVETCKGAGLRRYSCEERWEAESPRHRVEVDGFELDKTEVTNAQFGRFVQATGYQTTAESEGWSVFASNSGGKWAWVREGRIDWRRPSGSGSVTVPSHPVLQVSWHDATAYCAWLGKRLPTEAEWELAARGSTGRTYPWGNRWEPAYARHFDNRGGEMIAPVGSYPAGATPLGVLDLAGNAREWTSSLFRPYPYNGTDGRENDSLPGLRTLRGGDWGASARELRAAARIGGLPTIRNNLIGFRCARTP